MSSTVGSKRNVKIFILYLMENINYPLNYVQLNDIIMQTDYVMYLDFAEAFNEMLDDGLIENVGKDTEDNDLFMPTERGKLVAGTMKSDILDSILDKSLTGAFRYLDFSRRGVVTKCSSERQPDGKYIVRFSFIEKDVTLFSSELLVDSENRAERMKENFRDRPEVMYKGINALFAGNMNFLFS